MKEKNRIDLNDYVYLDLTDIKQQKEVLFTLPVFNIRLKDVVDFNAITTKKYARLVAKKDFICKGEVVKAGTKGGYLAISGKRSRVKIGENSWVGGNFMGTKTTASVVKKGSKIGKNSLVEKNVVLNNNVVIGDNAFVGYDSKIGAKTILGNNSKCSVTIMGPKVLIGDNSTIGLKSLDGKTAIGDTCFIGISPNYYQHYWWDRHIEPKRLSRKKMSLRDCFEKYVKEKYYANLTTRIGANVQLDKGVVVNSGATIGDDAKLGYQAKVGVKKQVDNKRIVANKEMIM